MSINTTKQSVNGTFWSMIERLSTMGIQLLCTLVIAQFLSPSEFGLVGMMTIFIAFSYILVDGGFGQAIVREPNVTATDYSSIFYFNIALGGFAYLFIFFCAPWIALFYDEPQLTILLRVDFFAVVFQAFSVVQMAQLQKSVNFSRISKVSFIAVVCSGVIGIAVAYWLRNVWALVAQNVSFIFLRALLFWIFSQWHPSCIFHWKSIQKYLKFSLNLLGTRLIAAITDNAPNLLIGKSFTATDLGNYTVPNKLQISIAGTLSFAIHRVSYPIMSTFQDDIDRLRSYSQKVVGMAFYITAPIMLLLMIESDDIFAIILPPEWAVAALYFKYLCFIGAIFCFADINMDILIVRNKANLVFRMEIIRKTLFILILVVGVMTNMTMLIYLLVIWNIFNALYVSYFAGKEIQCSLWQQLGFHKSTLLFLLIAAITTLLTQSLLVGSNLYIRFILTMIVGFTTYILVSWRGVYLNYILSNISSICKK